MSRIIGCVVLAVVLAGGLLWGVPQYNVYRQTLKGQANLQQAEQERQILVEQAKAEKESAELRARAIEIVGQAAKDFPEYREQEFMGAFAEALQNESVSKVIFVPTEANVPIVQARSD